MYYTIYGGVAILIDKKIEVFVAWLGSHRRVCLRELFFNCLEVRFGLNKITHQKKTPQKRPLQATPLASPKANAKNRIYCGFNDAGDFWCDHLVCRSSECSCQITGWGCSSKIFAKNQTIGSEGMNS